MGERKPKPRLAVISPFLDKKHGTERRVVEWISGLADNFDIHVYSQQTEDLDLSQVIWHRISRLPGPHLFNYLWWIIANHVCRAWDRHIHGIRAAAVFSPGINCLDADVISVHIVFSEYLRRVSDDLKLRSYNVSRWPQLIHRQLYYRVVARLERRLYRNPQVTLVLIARRTAGELAEHFGRREPCPVVYVGLDHQVFNPERRTLLRSKARSELGFSNDRFVVLLIGNHWINKGLPVLLEAVVSIRELPVDLLVVGREDAAEFEASVREKSLTGRVQFRRPRADVEFYYAAADVYAGPSLEDTFAQPPAEAMACGLPVIVSATNGSGEIMTHESDGLILQDPTDWRTLGEMIRRLYQDQAFRNRLGRKAHETAKQYTWKRNAHEMGAVLEGVLRRKSHPEGETLVQES